MVGGGRGGGVLQREGGKVVELVVKKTDSLRWKVIDLVVKKTDSLRWKIIDLVVRKTDN